MRTEKSPASSGVKYRPRGRVKLCEKSWHSFPTVGVYTSGAISSTSSSNACAVWAVREKTDGGSEAIESMVNALASPRLRVKSSTPLAFTSSAAAMAAWLFPTNRGLNGFVLPSFACAS